MNLHRQRAENDPTVLDAPAKAEKFAQRTRKMLRLCHSLRAFVQRNDEIEDDGTRVENLIRGILAGNIFDLGSAQKFLLKMVCPSWQVARILYLDLGIDDLDAFKTKWTKNSWEKVVIFVDNSGADIILGILP
ncbi:hypothetical protein ABZP36_020919 [Zizania latifolia]